MADKLPIDFGNYILESLVARGGMAEIYRARMRTGIDGFEKAVAIKKILPNLAENDEFITMLIDEARISVTMNHANIAQVYDLGRVDDSYYIAMEYIPGVDLSTVIKHLGKEGYLLPLDHAIFITKELCAGLYYAHSKKDEQGNNLGVVHRDISPHNLLVSFNGNVKIIDFGVAKASVKLGQTRMGVIKGKLLYMAPEQAMAKGIDCRADVFSAGLCLYRMLTGHLPFEAENEFQIYNNVLTARIAPPRELNPEIPEDLNRVVMKSLERDLNQRYADAWLMHQDLERVLHRVSPGYTMHRLSEFMNEYFDSYRPAPMGGPRASGQHNAASQGSYPSAPSVNSGRYQQTHSTPPNTPADWQPAAVAQPVYAQAAGVQAQASMAGPTVPMDASMFPPMPGGEPSAPSIPSPEELGFKPRNPELLEDAGEYDADPTIDMQLDDAALERMAAMARQRRAARGEPEPSPAVAAAPSGSSSKLPLILGVVVVVGLLLLALLGGALFFFSGGEDEASGKAPEKGASVAAKPDKPGKDDKKDAPDARQIRKAFQAAVPQVTGAHLKAYNAHSATMRVKVESEPEGAEIYLKRKGVGQTPIVLEVERSEDPVELEFRLEGYQKDTTEVIPNRDRQVRVTLEERARSGGDKGAAGKDKKPKKNQNGDLLEPW